VTAGSTLTIWTIFNRPLDQPERVVVRGFDVVRGRGAVPRQEGFLFNDVETARAWLQQEHPGLVCLGRDPSDHPTVVESWV
jgi:hypothetical protein